MRAVPDPAKPGIAQVKFWSIVLIAYHYIVLRGNGAEPSVCRPIVRTTDQSKARRLRGGTEFFSTNGSMHGQLHLINFTDFTDGSIATWVQSNMQISCMNSFIISKVYEFMYSLLVLLFYSD